MDLMTALLGTLQIVVFCSLAYVLSRRQTGARRASKPEVQEQHAAEHPNDATVVIAANVATKHPRATNHVTPKFYESYFEAISALNRTYMFGVSFVGIRQLPHTQTLSPIPANYCVIQNQSPRVVYACVKHQPRMPFYRNVEVVMPPIQLQSFMSLSCAAYRMGVVRFTHQFDNRSLLAATSDNNVLIVRFFKIDQNEAQLDTLPPNVTVEVRSATDRSNISPGAMYSIRLKRTSIVNFRKMKPKHEKPLIIPASFAQRERSIDLIVSYTPSESDFEFAVGIFRAQTVTVDEELESIRRKPLEYAVSKQCIIEELKRSEDGGDTSIISTVEMSSLPLICPVSKSRMILPCRSLQCPVSHTCDAHSFLQMNFERPTWRCFSCNKSVFLQDLYFESFVANWAAKHKGGASDASINLVLNEKSDDLQIKQPVSGRETTEISTAPSAYRPKKNLFSRSLSFTENNTAAPSGISERRDGTALDANATICLSSSEEEGDDADVVAIPTFRARFG